MAFIHFLGRWQFEAFWYQGSLPEPKGDMILWVANHSTWWDAFWIERFHQLCLPNRPIYTLILESSYQREPFLRGIGTIPIQADKPKTLMRALKSLRVAKRETWPFSLIVFPQGELLPAGKRPLGFKSGVEWFRKELEPCLTVPIAIHVECLHSRKPHVFFKIGRIFSSSSSPPLAKDLESEIEALQASILKDLCAYPNQPEQVWTRLSGS
jgi:1-acyl-sn-glycerol-3-phosphate acyltransferase